MRGSNKQRNTVSFFWFDFHAECKKMHYENLDKLMSMTEHVVKEGEYVQWFMIIIRFFSYDTAKKEILSLQSSVIRTNCIDCLDRTDMEWELRSGTNVGQGLYAKHMLFEQLFGEKGEDRLHECL